MPPLHPDARRLIDRIRSARHPPIEDLPPAEARQAFAESCAILQAPAHAVGEVRDLSIDGPAGAIRLRIYRGRDAPAGQESPALLFLHGGGWVIGDLSTHDGLCRRLANAARFCVVSVDYRLAPESPFPAALEDAVASLDWMFDNASELRIDRQRIAVGGDSAGGNLAAVLGLLQRDRVALQLLMYPSVDLATPVDPDWGSGQGYPLTGRTLRAFVGHYVPEPDRRGDWRASPLRAPNLAGVPPAIVLTVGHDPLCEEGRAYARRLEETSAVAHLHVSDQIHGFLTLDGAIKAGGTFADLLGHMLADLLR